MLTQIVAECTLEFWATDLINYGESIMKICILGENFTIVIHYMLAHQLTNLSSTPCEISTTKYVHCTQARQVKRSDLKRKIITKKGIAHIDRIYNIKFQHMADWCWVMHVGAKTLWPEFVLCCFFFLWILKHQKIYFSGTTLLLGGQLVHRPCKGL